MKAIFGVENDEPLERIIRDASGKEDYEDELGVQKVLWRATPLGL
jgi:hypothetical protein